MVSTPFLSANYVSVHLYQKRGPSDGGPGSRMFGGSAGVNGPDWRRREDSGRNEMFSVQLQRATPVTKMESCLLSFLKTAVRRNGGRSRGAYVISAPGELVSD